MGAWWERILKQSKDNLHSIFWSTEGWLAHAWHSSVGFLCCILFCCCCWVCFRIESLAASVQLSLQKRVDTKHCLFGVLISSPQLLKHLLERIESVREGIMALYKSYQQQQWQLPILANNLLWSHQQKRHLSIILPPLKPPAKHSSLCHPVITGYHPFRTARIHRWVYNENFGHGHESVTCLET